MKAAEDEAQRFSRKISRYASDLGDPWVGTARDEDWPVVSGDDQSLFLDRRPQFSGGEETGRELDRLCYQD